MGAALSGRRILILVASDYEDLEVHYPRLRLGEEGASVTVAGLGEKTYKGKRGYPVDVDADVEELRSTDFDAVVIPGGWAPDHLRRSRAVLRIVREMSEAGKPVAAICHGAWVPISAGILKGRRMTSFEAVRDDCVNAGAEWVDDVVVVDRNLITSRKPSDLPAFCLALIAQLRG